MRQLPSQELIEDVLAALRDAEVQGCNGGYARPSVIASRIGRSLSAVYVALAYGAETGLFVRRLVANAPERSPAYEYKAAA